MTRICKLLILLMLLGFASGCSVSVRPVDDEATPTATAGTSGRVGSVRSTPVASVTVTPQPSGDTPVATEVSETPTPTTAGEVPTLPPPPTARPMPTMPPNPAPSPSPTPTARPEPTAPPPVTPTPTGPPVCAELPVRGFGLVWHDQPAVARQIGCPVEREVGVAARVQPYMHGLMVWLDIPHWAPGVDSVPWVITLAGNHAARHRVPDVGQDWNPEAAAPTGAFAWVWENVYTDRERLGEATAAYWATDAALQRFERGTMLWLREPGSGVPTIYVIEADLAVSAYGVFQSFVDRSFS